MISHENIPRRVMLILTQALKSISYESRLAMTEPQNQYNNNRRI